MAVEEHISVRDVKVVLAAPQNMLVDKRMEIGESGLGTCGVWGWRRWTRYA
jgi:hypothetical protein